VQDAADSLAKTLSKELENLSGPVAPVINRVRNLFLMEILIKLPKDAAHLPLQKKVISNCIDLLKSEKKFRSVTVLPDVDPV